MVTLD